MGGGTAGWLSAAFLFSQLPQKLNRAVSITLVESSDIPTIGVGEATIPSLRDTLAACGIQEHVFLKAADATFKHGIEFINWKTAPDDDSHERYFHPFGEPIKVAGHNPAWQWIRQPAETRGSFADLFSVQSEIAKSGRTPKHFKDRPYEGALAYAYHLDAGKLAQFLKEKFRAAGVRHVIDTVEHVTLDGDIITACTLKSGTTLTADLFIDCTGFAARLINSDRKNRFLSKSDILFVDRAVTTRIPHDGISSVNGYTKCTAQSSGWIWDIALRQRRGVGHVYSSKYMDDQAAASTLATYLDRDVDEIETRKLSMRIGYHHQQWRGNCVAIGLSSGFLEPLESTGIYLIEMANWALIEMLPRFVNSVDVHSEYDRVMHHHYENIVDFLKLHYYLSDRTDSAFWRDNKKSETIPETLQANLTQWKHAVPGPYDFSSTIQCFSANNYQFVYYGMGGPTPGDQVPDNGHTDPMMSQLATRRARLREFVLRDTVANHDYYVALDKL